MYTKRKNKNLDAREFSKNSEKCKDNINHKNIVLICNRKNVIIVWPFMLSACIRRAGYDAKQRSQYSHDW